MSERREQLLDTALELFNERGYHATGIDTILSEAGVAKMTLYKHFRSKGDLILAALRRYDERFRNDLARHVDRHQNPRDRLFAVMEFHERWCWSPDFHGCRFVNACAEFGDPEHPVHGFAAEHVRLVTRYFTQLATQAGASDPPALAAELFVLFEGAAALVNVTRDKQFSDAASRLGRQLIDAACS